ncbi:hypothetical protein JL49_04380 [Pseudoalteromonas luteoviolacea]|uniref:Cxxc_20_cxxc protein n=1 Tax=Pseudoalteromonas luteoviolacea NCIMB 1942 TaxID=1365253 RepID=A0A167C4E9_9GAMM|nr:hypothetical protein N482_09930 [Pseudoalteromonas luteoviolacea NCIMB 1942]KZX01602.1 hypothetical protein JL49_04380 [Pseudoalteromonas luteoviolacea]
MLKDFATRPCPCCNKPLTLSERAPLLNRAPVHCKHCAKSLKPNFYIMLFNVFWLSMSVSWAIETNTELNYLWALSAALIAVSVIAPLFDLLFPLEEEQYD